MSIGFWVATIMNGSGRAWLTPSTVTVASSASSSSADCVLRRRPVQFVEDDDVGEHRPGTERHAVGVEAAARHHRAGDVARQQIGRALDPMEAAADAAREHLCQQCLADPGDVLDQQVPAGQDRGHGDLGDVVLAGDDLVDRVDQPGPELVDTVFGRGHGRRRQRFHEGASARSAVDLTAAAGIGCRRRPSGERHTNESRRIVTQDP